MKHSNYSPLLTDLYQFTMAYGYYKLKMHERDAVFHLLFRKNPFKGNYALTAGLASVVEFLNEFHFKQEDLDYLGSLKNTINEPLFSADFLHYLASVKFTGEVDAIPEGTIVFPQEPILRIQGPLLQCQLLESPLLNMINFQTLIATKAARVCRAAQGDAVVEFGMRRAQGPDGALSASRAAYIGGCVATSNTLAGQLFDIPVRGTQAHSWVSAFPSELDAFSAYASVMPHNGVFLVDTYHTIDGVKNAITVGKQLREKGADLLAIRLDSGDLTDLSIKSRQLLDAAGFKKTNIMASNSLDEYAIAAMKEQGAAISIWGVGTNLVTANDQSALDGVYKLSALKNAEGVWENKLKLSDTPVKISNPGRHQVRRFFCDEQYVMDVIYDLSLGMPDVSEAILLNDSLQQIKIDDYDGSVDLLQPVMKDGKLVEPLPSIHDIRDKAIEEINHFYQTHGNKNYPVGLEKNLFTAKETLIKSLR